MAADMSQSMSRLADMPLTTMPGAGQASELAAVTVTVTVTVTAVTLAAS